MTITVIQIILLIVCIFVIHKRKGTNSTLQVLITFMGGLIATYLGIVNTFGLDLFYPLMGIFLLSN